MVKKVAKKKRVESNRSSRFVSSVRGLPKTVLFVFIVVIFVIGGIGYVQARNYYEKRTMLSLHKELIIKMNELTYGNDFSVTGSEQFCEKPNQKLGNGILACSVVETRKINISEIDNMRLYDDIQAAIGEQSESSFSSDGKTTNRVFVMSENLRGCRIKVEVDAELTVRGSCVKKANSQYFHQKS